MIIKMFQNDGWLFLDGMLDVYYWNGETGNMPHQNAETTDEYYLGSSPNTGFTSSVRIRAKRANGKEVAIDSDIQVYLLNDNGKTIERLN